MIPLIIQVAIFVSYVAFILYRYGVLPSISESWYVLPQNQKALFTLFTWGVGIPMLFYDSEALFIAGSALTFVGAATQFKTTAAFTKQVHYIGAVVGIVVPLLYFGFASKNWVPLIAQVVGTAVVMLAKTSNKIWWTEIVAFVCVLTGMLTL
jgi:hypothetical protein